MAKKELKNNQTLSNIDYMINLFGHFQTILLFTHGHLATHVLSITLPHGHSFMSGTNAFEALLVRGPLVFTECAAGLSDRQQRL